MSNDCLQCTSIKAFPAIATMCLLATAGNDPVHGLLELADIGTSSTYRKLKAVIVIFQSYAERSRCPRLKVCVDPDNIGVSRILAVGVPTRISRRLQQ